jgi:hypothetical protein
MFHNHPNRPKAALLVSGALLALSLGPAAQVASAQCADPRGNSYCNPGGLVNMPNPSPPTNVNVQNPNPPRNVNVQNPNPPTNVNVQNPNPPRNVNVQNPNPPTNVNVQNPNPPTNVDVQNPDAGNSDVQNPNAPIAIAGDSQLAVLNGGGAPGDAIVVTGQGFGKNNNMFLNVVDSTGTEWDTDSRAFSCNETENWVIVIYQNYGLGCSSGARPGRLNRSNPDGAFSGVVQIPPTASSGPAKLCAKGVFPTTCTPISISS